MCKVKLHFPNGDIRELTAVPGTRMADLIDPGQVDMPCGGAGRCGKCRIAVTGALSPPDDTEKRLLGGDLTRGIRLACRTSVLGDVELFLREARGAGEIQGDGIMPIFDPDPIFTRYGAAVDIGTTTLAARLYGRNGSLLAWASAPNPQRHYGADVISRIEKSIGGERENLARCIREGVDALLLSMANNAGIAADSIDTVVLTGNTTMLYLLTAKDPYCLSRAPFLADELFGRVITPAELTLPSSPDARLYLPRCMSAFIGADITTALLASRICDKPGKTLMADIGTNGEIAFWDGEKLLCCSTAAGPVFEGAEISHGMPGRPGAIDHVEDENGHTVCHVIGSGKACGICGSGVIDAVSVLCELKVIDESGYMEEPYHLTPEVLLTGKDVRMVQLAKSAICAGILTLLDKAGVKPGDLDQFAIAGGFGSFLDLDSAVRIGLFPAELRQKAVVLGNAALSGASMILLQRAFADRASELAERSQTVDLTTSSVFTETYIDCMEF